MVSRTSNEDFIRAWMKAVQEQSTASDLARTLNTAASNVSHRARRLRSKGVNLPALPDGRGPRRVTATEVEKLNTLIGELTS